MIFKFDSTISGVCSLKYSDWSKKCFDKKKKKVYKGEKLDLENFLKKNCLLLKEWSYG